jgi:hypothetical protein
MRCPSPSAAGKGASRALEEALRACGTRTAGAPGGGGAPTRYRETAVGAGGLVLVSGAVRHPRRW